MSFKELTKYRMQFLKVLSEKEFSLDFYIFAMEAVQDAQYISEEDAENVAKLIVDCVNAGDGEDEIIEKARLKVDYAKYVFGVKKALYGLGVEARPSHSAPACPTPDFRPSWPQRWDTYSSHLLLNTS